MDNKEYAKIVARNLRFLMYQNAITQATLSRDLEIPKTTISGWLNGNRTPRMKYIDLLCHYFNVTRTDLMDDQNGYYGKNIKPDPTENLAAKFNTLTAEGQKQALEYLNYLLSKDEYKR